MELIIITGLSGAGKTQAVHCLEDLGYYCVDNIPPALISEFVRIGVDRESLSRMGFVVDIRGGEFFDDLTDVLSQLKAAEINVRLMFLDASDQVLVRRYKETRRAHPLAPGGNIREGIRLEREKLAMARKMADFVIDTSSLKTAQLYRHITDLLQPENSDDASFTITVESFGFKFGMPLEADWVLDARFLQNPFYVPSLKHLTGRNRKVRDYVMKSGECVRFAARIAGAVIELLPSYVREGKYHLHISIGCTGGRHRSVVAAEELASRLRENGLQVTIIHRELDRSK